MPFSQPAAGERWRAHPASAGTQYWCACGLASAPASPACAAVLTPAGICHHLEAAISRLHYGDFFFFFLLDSDTELREWLAGTTQGFEMAKAGAELPAELPGSMVTPLA